MHRANVHVRSTVEKSGFLQGLLKTVGVLAVSMVMSGTHIDRVGTVRTNNDPNRWRPHSSAVDPWSSTRSGRGGTIHREGNGHRNIMWHSDPAFHCPAFWHDEDRSHVCTNNHHLAGASCWIRNIQPDRIRLPSSEGIQPCRRIRILNSPRNGGLEVSRRCSTCLHRC